MRPKSDDQQQNQHPDQDQTALYDSTDSVSPIGIEQWKLILLISLFALTALGLAGCLRSEHADPTGEHGTVQRINVTNGRFERLFRPTLQGGDFWLKQGDTLDARWDEYTIYFSQVGANCDNVHFDGVACRRCQFVNQNSMECGGGRFPQPDYLDLVMFSGMMSDAALNSVPLDASKVGLGDLAFNPTQNSSYRLSTIEEQKLDTWATTRVFVVAPSPSQGVPKLYRGDPLPQPGVTDAVFYKVVVPDNFSGCDNSTPPHCLTISKVRVLKGVPNTTSADFGLKDGGTLLKPSRIVMLPDFSDGSKVYDFDRNAACYARYPNGVPDQTGNIDLTSCYPCNSATGCGSMSKTVNPEFIPPGGGHLTWAIEFKPMEGGEVPVLADGEVVAIEFTILTN